jgi:hypothetical protein
MMKNDKNAVCRACGNIANWVFSGQLLDNVVDYYDCPHCGYVQTETPYWLDRAYAKAINETDTGIMVRNLANAKIVLATLLALKKLDGTLVDCAGGYGILVRLLRDYGINALWSDLYCKNLVASGFERATETADLVTAFEAFEHFVNPSEELDRLLEIAPNVLFSTQIIADLAPKQDDWWYYGKNHGQHIGFFRIQSLTKLARDRGKYLISDGANYHLISDQPLSEKTWKVMMWAGWLIPLVLRRSLTQHDHEMLMKKHESP